MMMIAAAALFTACGETPEEDGSLQGGDSNNNTDKMLETPAPTAEVGESSITISWAAITGADSYTLNLQDKNYRTSELTYTFENLDKGEYTISVKATGAGYKDSDFGTVTATVTGFASVDWFTQTAEARAGETAIDFCWKGTGVQSLAYGIFRTDTADKLDEATIKANLTDLASEDLAHVNSEEGFAATFVQGLHEFTTYSIFALVTNKAGAEYLARTDVTTCEVAIAEEVDWFTQTAEARAGETAIDFCWKGTGVQSLAYGIFRTDTADKLDEATIKANLTDLASEDLAHVNSEEGFAATFVQGLLGSTSYSLFALVTNKAGAEYLARTDVTTCEVAIAEETAAWLGNWTAYTEKVAAYNQEMGDFEIKDQRNDLNLTIMVEQGTTNDVLVYGLTKVGNDVPAFGTVTLTEDGRNCLNIWSFQNLGDVGNGYYAYWMTYCSLASGGHTFATDKIPAWMLYMDADGNVTCEMYTGVFSNNGKIYTAQATDVFALNQETNQIGFMSLDKEGTPNNIINYGPMKGIRKTTLNTSKVFISASVVEM